MSTLQLKEIYEQSIEAYNRGDLDTFFDGYAKEFVHHNPNAPAITNLEAYRQSHANLKGSFPGLKLVVDDLITLGAPESGTGVVRFHVTGTGKGTFEGFPVEGKSLNFDGMIIHHIKNGKVVEDWEINDMLAVATQLGMIPPPG